ncbi:MAG: NAD(P)H-dependent oxidoreductase [archaeon]
MKVLAIVSTARKDGLLSEITKNLLIGARDAENSTELLNLYDYRIGYCKGCWTCSKTGKCVIKDDFQQIFSKLEKSDVIILASPVYFSNVSGVMKNFFDRQIGISFKEMKEISFLGFKFTWRYGPSNSMSGKKIIYLGACTVPWPFNLILNETPLFFKAMDAYAKDGLRAKIIAKLLFTDSRFFNLKVKKRRIIKKAYKIGRNIK